MNNGNLFDQSINSLDGRYLAVRDDPRFRDLKDFAEELWIKFQPYADPSPFFQTEIAKQFNERFWEMYLGCTLINLGFELVHKKDAEGPDFHIILNDSNLWIDAVVSNMGSGDNAVPEPVFDKVTQVPEEKILLRFTNSISKKYKGLQKHLSKGIVKPNDLFVIGINGFLVTHLSDTEIPYIIKAVLGYGSYFATIDINTLKITSEGYKRRDEAKTKKDAPVSTNVFSDGTYPRISGLIYSNADLWNLPASLGSDFLFIHNSRPNNPISLGWLPIGTEYWVEGDKLRIRSTSYPQEKSR